MDIKVIFGKFKSLNNKLVNMTHLLQIIKEQKCEMGEGEMQWPKMVVFREKVSDFSLDLRQIRPSAVFGTRRRIDLRGKGIAWVPDLRSFLKLREVGVSPYLSFIPILSVLSMFESNEAV